MLKKITVSVCAALCALTVSVCAKTVREACVEVSEHFGAPLTQNTEIIKKCKNYRSISESDAEIAARAMSAGLLIPKNNVLNMDSEDLTPVIDGITAYGIKNGYKVVTDKYYNGAIDNAPVTEDAFLLTDPVHGEEYTALIKENKCAAVMPLGTLKRPVLYKAKLYIADGGTIAFDSVMRYSIGMWMDAGLKGRLLLAEPVGFSVDADLLNQQFIDKTIYFYGDAYDQTVKIYSMRSE